MKKILCSAVAIVGISATTVAIAANDYQYASKSSYGTLSNAYAYSFRSDKSFLQLESLSQRFYGESRDQEISKIQFIKGFSANKLYLNLSAGSNEHNGVVGLKNNNTTISFMSGSAESNIRDAGQYTDVYRFGLHGGNNIGFNYIGSAVDQEINNKINLQLGFTKLSSNLSELENRGSQYLKLASDNGYGRFSLLERGADKIGYAIEAGHQLGRHNLLVQHVNISSGKELYRLKSSYALNHATDMVLDLSNVRDEKHYDQLRYSGLICCIKYVRG